jgi:hypothetical protein
MHSKDVQLNVIASYYINNQTKYNITTVNFSLKI